MESRGVILVVSNMILFEIEHSHIVRTCDEAIPAANTPVLIDNHDPVFTFVGCFDGTDQGAGRIITLVTQERGRYRAGIIDCSANGRLSNPMNVDIRIAMKGHIVFAPTSIRTVSAISPALSYVYNHAPAFPG
jgi:hypothetical protein